MRETKLVFRLLFISLIIGLSNHANADVLKIQPYAQWTFDTPMEEIIYRSSSDGFPIKLIRTKDLISLYDSTGNIIRETPRAGGDEFIMNASQTGFMLVEVHPSIRSQKQEQLYSFQVFSASGIAEYTFVHAVDLVDGNLSYQLTDQRSLLLTERGQPWVLEIHGEDTLLYINSCKSGYAREGTPKVQVSKLKSRNELITAISCADRELDDSSSIELRLWNRNNVIGAPTIIPGDLQGIHSLPTTDYYFLEIGRGVESTLTLYNRSDTLVTYPWKTWKISLLGQRAAFVISEKDFNVINLGDGSVITNYHPIDLSTISDAIYLPEWGLFLYLRYEPYFREDGRQAFRKFELEGVNKSGRIVHRSSFGTWSYSLPDISQIDGERIAIHMYNAVLMYQIGVERE